MKLELFGFIGCIIAGKPYRIASEDDKFYIIHNTEKINEFKTFNKAYAELFKINNEANKKAKESIIRPDTYKLGKLKVGETYLFPENLIKQVRVLMIYHKKAAGKNFETSFVFIDGIRKFKVTRTL